MKLYSAPLSLFARKVEIALGEKSLPFEREMVPFTQRDGYAPKHPVVLAANPKAQVPVLVDGDLTLFDSTLILEYLEDAHPAPALYPVGARLRARCRMLELYADEIMLVPLVSLMRRTTPPDPDPARQAIREAEARLGDAAIPMQYDELSRRLGGQAYFCGDAVSVADIAVFMSVLFGQRLGGPRLAGFPALEAWYRRSGGRPVFARIAAEIAAADRELSEPVRV